MWIFLAIFTLLVTLLSGYAAARVGRAFEGRARRAVHLVFAGLALGVVLAPVLVRKVPGLSASAGVAALYFYMGAAAILIVALALGDLFQLAARRAVDEGRRVFLRKSVPLGALGVSTALSIEGLRVAQAGPEVERVSVRKPGLPPGLQGLKIAQLSDLHVGNTIRRGYVETVVERTLALRPDLIALTGDFVDGSAEELRADLEPLRRLRAPFGVYFITGNHEYFWDAPAWMREFAALGFTPLSNEHRVVERAGARLVVAGLPDISGARFGGEAPDPERALRGAPPADFTLFLAHQPNAYRLIERVACDLQLSGHTHAGQFFPIRLIAPLVHRYNRGLYRHRAEGGGDRQWVYVNRGTGYWGPPNRLSVPSEITLLELLS